MPSHWFSVTAPDFSQLGWQTEPWARPHVSARERGNVSLFFPLFPPPCDCWAASLPARSTGNTWNCCILPVLAFPDPISPSGCNSRAESSQFERQELLCGVLSTLIHSSSSSSFHPGFAVSHVGEGCSSGNPPAHSVLHEDEMLLAGSDGQGFWEELDEPAGGCTCAVWGRCSCPGAGGFHIPISADPPVQKPEIRSAGSH